MPARFLHSANEEADDVQIDVKDAEGWPVRNITLSERQTGWALTRKQTLLYVALVAKGAGCVD